MKYSKFSLVDMIWAHYSHRGGLPPRAGLAVRAGGLCSLRIGRAGDRVRYDLGKHCSSELS